jgi:hypothetical protein
MEQIGLFVTQHSIVHSAEVGDEAGWSLADSVLKGLSEEQLRRCPEKGMNSIVWLMWHMARTEDVAVNLLVAGRPQVLDDSWLERLGLSERDIGTGMRDEEVADVSERVDIPALLAYRNAVGQRTREVVRRMRPEELDEIVEPESALARLDAEGAVRERARRVAEFWAGKKKSFILSMPATGHAFMHLSEAVMVRKRVG